MRETGDMLALRDDMYEDFLAHYVKKGPRGGDGD
jgi:hypothetical protein